MKIPFVSDEGMNYLEPFVERELVECLPAKLLDHLFRTKQYEIFLPRYKNEKFFDAHELGKGESQDEIDSRFSTTSHVFCYERAIVLVEHDGLVRNSYPVQTPMHEVGHAVNYSLGDSRKSGEWISNDLFFPPLDSYAEKNGDEAFATAFAAYCYTEDRMALLRKAFDGQERLPYEKEDLAFFIAHYAGYSHTREELFGRFPDTGRYFENLFKKWK